MVPSNIFVNIFLIHLYGFFCDATILTNQVGYDVKAPKRAVVLGQATDTVSKFTVFNSSNVAVKTGVPTKIGGVDKWKNWIFWQIDFDISQPGDYSIQCDINGKSVRSEPFKIVSMVLEENTLSDVLYYFKTQRCTGLLEKADSSLSLPNGTGSIDLRGGWYDATGDYGKHMSQNSFATWFNPQQVPLTAWTLLRTYDSMTTRDNPNFREYRRRALDEAMFGTDFLARAQMPGKSFFYGVDGTGSEKLPVDRKVERAYHTGTKDEYATSYRAGGGIAIAALARASTFDVTQTGDFSPKSYLSAAEAAFTYLEKHNNEHNNDGKENIVDDYCALVAAVELYLATKKSEYKTAADKRAQSLMSRLVSDSTYKNYWRADDKDRPYFHPSDSGLPVISLLMYYNIANSDIQSKVSAAIESSLKWELSITSEVSNPFGYSRQYVQDLDGTRRGAFFFPHHTEADWWWQGENARIASLAAAARMARDHFKSDHKFAVDLDTFATNQLNWILGLNPYDACMLHGSGRNNPRYIFKGAWEYTNAPGSIVNGITSGLTSENDIDYNIPYSQTHVDNDWRWVEQWIPHGSWYMLSVALGPMN